MNDERLKGNGSRNFYCKENTIFFAKNFASLAFFAVEISMLKVMKRLCINC
jgi:hypothetical protein